MEFVRAAAGPETVPYPYQRRLAEEGLPDVLRVPTGSGKTLAAVLPWLFRRTRHPDPAVRAETLRWLVVVLPQRTLVEQTVTVVRGWMANLGDGIPVHVLMGGEDPEDADWKRDPQRERIFIGTQDMVLSRVLMRGFAESRAGWPMSFGLLNAGVQFVFDEVQLMGPGLTTSLQLQGLRELLGVAQPCRSMWMSATVPSELSTVDFRRVLRVVGLDDEDRAGALGVRLDAGRTVRRLDLGEPDAKRYPRVLAERVVAQHRPGTRTLVVLNTVDRAVQVFDALARAGTEAGVVLVHSRFRPDDRAEHIERALQQPGPAGLIVVSTQVLEAGVDVTSETLVTETAPWSSIVQRAGRCNRDGQARGARLLWTVPPPGRGASLPYDDDELQHTEQVLRRLEGRTVTSTDLVEAARDATLPVHPVLRRRDLLDLFDTAPDLSGNDIDVSPFIRDTRDSTVSVAWRTWPDDLADMPAVGRRELCPAPIAGVQDMLRHKVTRGLVYDHLRGEWRWARPEDVRPGAIVVLDADRGGYRPEYGFDPNSRAAVDPLIPPETLPDAVESDPQTVGCRRWVPLAEHLADTEREARNLVERLGELPGLTDPHREAIALAARYHDIGKAHPVFARSLEKIAADYPTPEDGIWAKSPGQRPLRHEPRHFRHELVSALLLRDETTGLLEAVEEPDLVVYLALAHHGKVRLTVRGRPDEPADQILGVTDGESTVDCPLPNGTVLRARPLSLAPTRMGRDSLTAQALALRDREDLGPFRLAFCEAVVRAADWRASAGYDGSAR
ncbi:type I-G CRISPR-associated helicase/endonuclease Cas3g [Gandjariella thermophila]|uniref:type I-G CRISPR-associated helicase/endonuclease Cas3g n=1 Tax=Gandjariella thermophila TaxID=1931992 RepID=UPI001CEF6733|nr:CRISPR-associated helicase Cas3' [Gandjariella thermophila]